MKPISNEDARAVLKLGRNRSWANLSSLVRLGLLVKQRQRYRASPYAEHLIAALSLTFQSVLAGKMPQVNVQGPGWVEALRLASEGVQMSYARGRIDQAEFTRQGRMLKELEAQLNVA